ncbi:MAG: P-loop NTPase [Rikenellaceae bacterium]
MRSKIESIVSEIGKVVEFAQNGSSLRVCIELNEAVSPLAQTMQRAIQEYITSEGLTPEVELREREKRKAKAKIEEVHNGTADVGRVVIVASGKGGVGKSSVAAALARSLAARGEKVGVLDADIYGPSQTKLFGMEGEVPYATPDDMIVPPVSAEGIKVMSIGFFVGREDALVWRGPMATSALKQLIHQTQWGGIDTLVVDLPPGTGDIHLSVADQLDITAAVIVTTPSELALSDVIRGVTMLSNDNIAVPIVGIVNNMAYFTPEDAPEKKYYIFGTREGLDSVAEQFSLSVVAEVPITGVVGSAIDYRIFDGLL